ncbi:unnamed protein product [Polarella glacialis]|uniref:4-hydroxy-4-methyl-2-oxoglutarate aldolase n=1 Tax=Polarella glacialis TaxID=89957 RepID=A0A813JTY4_POLGL|nr:unnamed protein product [Polarella glacialis]
MKTCDICDKFGDAVHYLDGGLLRNYGGKISFAGPVRTVKCFEDNSKVKQLLAEDGAGRVLVVDGGGSVKKALLGDLIAGGAVAKGWVGVVIYGCIRDSEAVSKMDIGILAIGTTPRKTDRKDLGDVDVEVSFGSVSFKPGAWLYADEDGVVVADSELSKL